jgi:hypothetical protein
MLTEGKHLIVTHYLGEMFRSAQHDNAEHRKHDVMLTEGKHLIVTHYLGEMFRSAQHDNAIQGESQCKRCTDNRQLITDN